MLTLKSFLVASVALTVVSGVSVEVIERTVEPQPSCTNYTPFVYAGCFNDPQSPRALSFNSGLDFSNMTVEECVGLCKGNNYKYAGLEYYGQCFCGASVSGTQTDESSCSYPCTGNANETCGGNSVLSVYQDTTFPTVNGSTISDFMPMGCYAEEQPGRALAYRQDQLSTSNLTVEGCLSACKSEGYAFAGVEFGQECYCGVVLGNGTAPLTSDSCNMPCTGNSSEICGGSATLNIYVAKDLESTEPCSASPPVSSSTSSVPTSTPTSPPSSTSSSSTAVTTSSSSSISSTSSTAISTPITTPPTSTSTSTKTTASLCTSTYTISPTPTCEYKCGRWCSNPLPPFNDGNSCSKAIAACGVQVASCFLQAGFPDSLNCFQFASWCSNIKTYCGNNCPGNSCSKELCKGKYPPPGPSSTPTPSLSTSIFPCTATSTKASTTTTAASTTSCVPVPTNTNICTQPNNPNKGYGTNSPVGGIALPCLTCNNIKWDFNQGNCFKLYTSPRSEDCKGYPRGGNGGPNQACKDACDAQYETCVGTYAQGCKNNQRGDNYWSAVQKCKWQWQDCYAANWGVSVSSSRCGSFNSGWF